MRLTRRIFMFAAVFAAMCLCLVLAGCDVADEDETADEPVYVPETVDGFGDDAEFEFALTDDGKGYAVTGLLSGGGNVTLPSYHEGLSVTEIGQEAFSGCDALTGVAVPSTVEVIGSYAFDSCEALTAVEMAEGVTEIGTYAFRGCSSLSSVTIPSSVEFIGVDAFSGCDALTEALYAGTADDWGVVEIWSGNEALEKALSYAAA